MKRIHLFLCAVLTLCLFTLHPTPARADWPSWEDVLKKIAPLMNMGGDQVEATIFAVKHPSCAATIVAYTAQQDYSLVGFIGALKITKLQSLPKIIPINGGNCKQMQPVRMAYEFVDKKGDDYLGKSTADFFRNLLADQINEGKAAIDEQIAAIPYVGTIITNWDCECDAAFDSNFPTEKLVDATVGTAISVVSSVKEGNYGEALGKLVTKLGPDIACKIGEEYSGVGSIPVVNDIAHSACSKIAGKVVGWVVDGAGSLAEMTGLIGGDHIPFDQYYAQMFTPELAKDGYMELANILYKKCYNYFEPTNLSESNSKKVCSILRDRYINESLGKIEWQTFQADRTPYYKKNLKPMAVESSMLSEAEFGAKKVTALANCKSYFNTMYPKATPYAVAYGGEAIDKTCDNFISFYKNLGATNRMDVDRLKAQDNYFYEVLGKLSPLCARGERNELKCQDGNALTQCKQYFPKACTKAGADIFAWLGGKEIPCCVGGGSTDSSFKMSMDVAKKRADESGGYCQVATEDPLHVFCTLEDAYKKCMAKTGNTDCSTVEKSGLGTANKVCCSFDPDKLSNNKDAMLIKSIVDELNGKKPNDCTVGGNGFTNFGEKSTLSNDPLVATCCNMQACQARLAADSYVKTGKFNMADTVCKIGPTGYVTAPCCQKPVFCETPQQPYDPSKRSKEDLEKAAKAVAESNGNCSFGKTKDGKEDLFKVVCKTQSSGKACYDTIGRSTWSGCQYTDSGYVSQPCCSLSHEAYSAKASADDLKKQANKPLDPSKAQKVISMADDKSDKPARKGARVTSSGGQKLVSIKLLSQKPQGGVNPFNMADVKGKIGGEPSDKRAIANDTPIHKEKPDHAPAPSAHEPPTPNKSPGSSPDIGIRRSMGAAPVDKAPSGFSCAGKPDGNYCKDVHTLVFCYHDAIATTQPCPSGCDATTKSCNAYKP